MFSATLSAQPPKKVTTQASAPKTEMKAQLDSFKIKVDSLLTRIDYLMQINNEQLNQININTSLKAAAPPCQQ
jgi:TolA-binding protein